MQDVYILSAARTPIGTFLGSLASVRAPQLGATAIAAALERAGVAGAQVGQVIMGNVLQAGVGQAPARQAALGAGLPNHVGATTINKVCGSGMRAVMDATNGIRAGEWEVVVAGGMESMSNAPYLLERVRSGYRMGDRSITDAMIKDGLWDPYGDKHMGQCAETCAQKYGLTRGEQDAFALQSYERARIASQEGFFSGELTGVKVTQARSPKKAPGQSPKGKELAGDGPWVTQDEEPFAAPLEKMPHLRPAFAPDGTVTAANASKLNDGAAAIVLGSATAARRLGRPPLARIISYASFAQEPEWFTTAPAGAITAALARAQLTVPDIHRWEINEAFALVTMKAVRDLNLDMATVNVHGGAVALGHPIGCSGARILTTLVHVLRQQRQRFGCAAICIGGGEGAAMVIENAAFFGNSLA